MDVRSIGTPAPARTGIESPGQPERHPAPEHASTHRSSPRAIEAAFPGGALLDDTSTTWNVPFTPLLLPTAEHAAHEGEQLLRFHPRDPRMLLSASQPTTDAATSAARRPPAADDAAAADGEAPTSDAGSRSGAAKVAMMIGIGGGFAQNAVDITRLLKKYPEAARAGRFEPSLGRMGRLPTAIGLTALTRPDMRIIDPSAPRVASLASAGKSFTRFDEIAMRSSVLLGTSLAAIQIGSAIPNLVDAVGKDGPWYENLAQTTSGRAGVIQLTSGSIGVGLFVTALRQTAGQGGSGIVNRVLAASKAPVMALPIWTKVGITGAALVGANELGFLAFMNRGEQRSAGTVLRESAQQTPVLNDAGLRTGVLLGAGGLVGFRAHRAIQAAGGYAGGGLAHIGKGPLIGGAVVAGLLGAQALGALRGMDRPANA